MNLSRSTIRRAAVGAILAGAVAAPSFGFGTVRAQGSWTAPACTEVSGPPAVTFTRDEGATLAPIENPLVGTGYTFGLAALDAPNTLVAERGGSILRSIDAGCSWSEIGLSPFAPLVVAAGQGGRAYLWADNNATLLRVDADGSVVELSSPVDSIVGLQADRADGARVRIGDVTGALFESTDAGATWDRVGTPAGTEAINVYRTSFDPADLDHVLVGTLAAGAFVTTDGGQSWTAAKGFAKNGANANVFTFAISPADGDVVWAMGIDLGESLANVRSEGRHIYRSTNGGLTFKRVVNHSRKVTIRNQPIMAAHPTDPNVLYFVFGTYFQNYGTDVYRVEARRKKVTKTHNSYDDVSSIAFNPADPSVMYLGLTSVEPQ